MNKFFLVVISSFFLIGCVRHIVFEPNELPDGHIGQAYYVPIRISGGTGPVVDFSYDIHPLNSGLKLIFHEKKYYTKYIYDNFSIEGEPKSKGVITIRLKGGVVASAGQDFEKKYEVNILD